MKGNDYGKIVKALLETSPWPWSTVGATKVWHTGKDGCAVAMIAEPEVQTSADFTEIDLVSKRWSEGMRNAEFIAASPLWLAQAIVDLVESEGWRLCWFHNDSRNLKTPGPQLSLMAQYIPRVLAEYGIDPDDWAELKRRLDAAKGGDA